MRDRKEMDVMGEEVGKSWEEETGENHNRDILWEGKNLFSVKGKTKNSCVYRACQLSTVLVNKLDIGWGHVSVDKAPASHM